MVRTCHYFIFSWYSENIISLFITNSSDVPTKILDCWRPVPRPSRFWRQCVLCFLHIITYWCYFGTFFPFVKSWRQKVGLEVIWCVVCLLATFITQLIYFRVASMRNFPSRSVGSAHRLKFTRRRSPIYWLTCWMSAVSSFSAYSRVWCHEYYDVASYSVVKSELDLHLPRMLTNSLASHNV